MCNYYSIGVESRIGLGFDKKRTGNRVCNDICYGWEGVKKMVCCYGQQKTRKIKEVVDHVATIDPESGAETLLFATGEEGSKSS